MIGFAATFYIRSNNVKKIINIQINIKRDSVIYGLLILEAIVIWNELPFAYWIGLSIILMIAIIYFKDIRSLVNAIFASIVKIIKKIKRK